MDIQLLLLLLGITVLFVIFLPVGISFIMGLFGASIFVLSLMYRLFDRYIESLDISKTNIVKG